MPTRNDRLSEDLFRSWKEDKGSERGLTLAEAYSLWLRDAPSVDTASRQAGPHAENQAGPVRKDRVNQRTSGERV
ncbi:MAG: hypothetical protein IT368_13570 [Candidatus Hydrogenedentes bacterium]|nr:hypothetical protein [Candidatus Hydrogenedentota bacterium]